MINEKSVESILALIESNNPATIEIDLTGKILSSEEFQRLGEALKTNTNVKVLRFKSQIGDAGTKAIAEALKINATLTSLYFGYTGIGDAGANAIAEALKTNATLTSLDFGYNGIGDAGANAIAEALKINTTLASLNLGDNKVGDVGAKAIIEALKTNNTLTSLHLMDNKKISAENMKMIEEALARNQTLAKQRAALAPIFIVSAFTEANKGNLLVNSIFPLLPGIMDHAGITPTFSLQKIQDLSQPATKSLQNSDTALNENTKDIVSQPQNTPLEETKLMAEMLHQSREDLKTKFFMAIKNRDLDAIKKYINEKGVDVNTVGKDGLSALHAVFDRPIHSDADRKFVGEAFIFLLKAGACINICDADGRSPLHYAAALKFELPPSLEKTLSSAMFQRIQTLWQQANQNGKGIKPKF